MAVRKFINKEKGYTLEFKVSKKRKSIANNLGFVRDKVKNRSIREDLFMERFEEVV
ncbi:MAG: hypothetical protein GQ474_01565 [Sulfurimonas sp.]|nr:hypothetical protein [Sulfurimonas sp.]